MFQRFPEHDGYEDPQLANFYGQALPLLKRGVPVQTVHMENLAYPETLKDIKILIASYSGMKPMERQAHRFLAEWVRNGGILLYCGRDDDPFQQVTEWWNSGGNRFATASAHLFEELALPKPYVAGEYTVGKGKVHILRNDPKEFVLAENGDHLFVDLLTQAYSGAGDEELRLKNYFSLKRGPYLIVSVLDESVDTSPFIAEGRFIDLFDPEIPVLHKKIVNPNQQALLYDIDAIDNREYPCVLATAARVSDEKRERGHYSFVAKSPAQTTNVMRIFLPEEVISRKVMDSAGEPVDHEFFWDNESKTAFLKFENDPDGITVQLEW
jgi:hypothetical protein